MSDESEKTKRKVRFHGRVQFKTIRHVADFSDDEIVNGWYRKKDFMRMSEEVSDIAQLIANGKETYNGEELCIRGLEHLVEEDVADYRAEKMIASIDAVLDEQDEQRDEDIYDGDIIAEIYTEIVTPLQREAYLVGLRDAKEGAKAAEQIPDLVVAEATIEHSEPEPRPPEVDTEESTTELKNSFEMSTLSVGEEGLKSIAEDDSTTPGEPGKGGAGGKASKNKTPQKRKSRTRLGLGTELSPLVRRRDGTFAFRNRDLEKAKAELSRQRKECVRDSLFKHLDSDDSLVGQPKGSMTKL
mmetsp:Transcript_22726/g.56152  ORF Transcript_22726/g.56152 Transcript_22726/m.56152 type:complete len:299 (+) Transcript_22726:1014-1910(+)